MKTKLLLVLALALVLVAGCGGAKFAEEKTLLTTVTKAMESFNSSIGSAGAPEEITKALGTFTGALEKVMPKMQELTKNHPEWEDNPPKELKSHFEKFEAATATFKAETMPKVMQYAKDNVSNTDLHNALKKFSGMASQL